MQTKVDNKVKEFTEVYSTLYPLVYSTIYTKVSNIDEAKDLCQEVFIRFFEKFEEVENPRKWLLGALRFVVLEHYKRKENKNLNIDDIFEDLSLTYVNGFRDTRLIIEAALEDMNNFEDEKSKVLFDLIAFYNFSYKEAAKQLALSERQIRYRYGLIVDRIIHYFKKKGIKGLEDLL